MAVLEIDVEGIEGEERRREREEKEEGGGGGKEVMYVTACVEDGGGQRRRERKGVEEEEREKGILCNCVGLSGVPAEDGVVGRQGGAEENLDGPLSHDQPPESLHFIVAPTYIWKVRAMSVVCGRVCVVNVCALSVLGAVCHVSKWSSEQ